MKKIKSLRNKSFKNSVDFWKEYAKLWRDEHDSVLKEVESIYRRVKRDQKDYGLVQKETLQRLSKLKRDRK